MSHQIEPCTALATFTVKDKETGELAVEEPPHGIALLCGDFKDPLIQEPLFRAYEETSDVEVDAILTITDNLLPAMVGAASLLLGGKSDGYKEMPHPEGGAKKISVPVKDEDNLFARSEKTNEAIRQFEVLLATKSAPMPIVFPDEDKEGLHWMVLSGQDGSAFAGKAIRLIAKTSPWTELEKMALTQIVFHSGAALFAYTVQLIKESIRGEG